MIKLFFITLLLRKSVYEKHFVEKKVLGGDKKKK